MNALIKRSHLNTFLQVGQAQFRDHFRKQLSNSQAQIENRVAYKKKMCNIFRYIFFNKKHEETLVQISGDLLFYRQVAKNWSFLRYTQVRGILHSTIVKTSFLQVSRTLQKHVTQNITLLTKQYFGFLRYQNRRGREKRRNDSYACV